VGSLLHSSWAIDEDQFVVVRAPSIVLNVCGTISAIDKARQFFILSVDKRSFISVGYEGALLSYCTSFEDDDRNELAAWLATTGDSLDEVVTIAQGEGLVVTLYTIEH